MLVRAALRLGGVLCVIVLCVWTALHLRPFEYPEGFEAAVPDMTCEPACLFGIQPGVTHADEAIQLIEASPLVAKINGHIPVGDKVRVSWRWADDYPELVATDASFFVYGQSGVVRSVHLKTNLPLSDFRVALPTPQQTFRVFTDNREAAHVIHSYRDNTVNIYHRYDCLLREASGVEIVSRDATLPVYYLEMSSAYGANPC